MKKSIFITLVLMLSCMLVISVAAEADFDVKSEWVNVVHVSYDELKDTADVTLIACGTDDEKINTPTLASGTKDVIFWGWASANGSENNKLEQRRLRYYSVLEIWTISLFRNNANKRSCSAVYENI